MILRSPNVKVAGYGLGNTALIVTKDADDIILYYEQTILMDAGNNAVRLYLPSTPAHGNWHTIKCIDATFDANLNGNGEDIDGSTNELVFGLNQSYTLQFDNDYGWAIL